MIETRTMTRKILEKLDEAKYELEEELDYLEDRKIEEKYLKDNTNNSIKDIYTLLDFYNSINNNIDRISFENFVSFLMQDEDKKEQILNEIKNISLLSKTGLLKFSKEKDNYSKQIIGNFLLKVSKMNEDITTGKTADKEIKKIKKQLNLLNKYKNYFAPIGIVKEIEDAKSYNNFLDILKLDDNDKTDALLMSLEFNNIYHIDRLDKYELDLQNKNDIIKQIYKINNKELEDISNLLSNKDVKDFIKKPKNIQVLDPTPVDIEDKKEDVIENDIVSKAKDYLDKNIKQISSLNEIQIEDLESTIDVYNDCEELREEVYRTTENVDRLLTYEIKKIFDNYDDNKENMVILTDNLKPVVDYIEKINKKESKRK